MYEKTKGRLLRNETTTRNTIARMYEIAFVTIFESISTLIPSEKIDMYLETLCNVLNIDYTSISVIRFMHLRRMAFTKEEWIIFILTVGMPYNHKRTDYRTVKKYRQKWEFEGMPQVMPMLQNDVLQGAIKKFVNRYLNLFFDDLVYIRHLRDFD